MLPPIRLDHRWSLATDATHYSLDQARYKLRSADSVTRTAFDFKRMADAGLDTGAWPEITAATDLQLNRSAERTFCEGLLLAGADNAEIARHMGCHPGDVQAFHDLFFDVRPYRENAGWVVARLFGGSLYSSVSHRDVVGKLHRIAWLGGPHVFLAYYTGVREAFVTTEVQDLVKDVLRKQSLLTSMSVSGNDESAVEILRLMLEDSTKDVASVAAGGDEQTANAMLGFLKTMTLTIADPTVEANQQLPARELRAHEFLVKDAPAAALDKPVPSN